MALDLSPPALVAPLLAPAPIQAERLLIEPATMGGAMVAAYQIALLAGYDPFAAMERAIDAQEEWLRAPTARGPQAQRVSAKRLARLRQALRRAREGEP